MAEQLTERRGAPPRSAAGAADERATADRRRPPRSRAVLVGGLVVLLALLTGLFAFGLKRDPGGVASPLLGHPAPRFTLETLDGGVIRLGDLRGRVVVVNFWASWCTPCREEHPNLLAAWERFRDQGVVLLGVVYQDSPDAVRGYRRELGGDWPILLDPGGATALDYGVYGIPETYFIGRDGIVRHKVVGAVSYEALSDQVSRLLRRPA